MNRNVFFSVATVIALLQITGCGEGKSTVATPAPAPAATPAPAEPDLAALEALVSRLKSSQITDFFTAKYAWSYDVKKSDSLVNPVQGEITAASKGEWYKVTTTFSYKWNNGNWVPMAVSCSFMNTDKNEKDESHADSQLTNLLFTTVVKKQILPKAFVDLSTLSPETKKEILN